MRFFADGPSIPNELLAAHDRGEVIFLCGSGVSRLAGLPDFKTLAQQVIKELGVPKDAKSHQLLKRAEAETDLDFVPPMDQVLGLLQSEYGTSLVEQAVHKRLRTPSKPDLSCHRTILKLSKSMDGVHRLVTTNFDMLFEAAQKGVKKHIAPTLPDLSLDPLLDGIVYLHGRLNGRRSDELRNLILGSADFGRAYLADGWATRFVRDLLAKYTIVLLGYSADDPPVRYLLQGIHSKNQAANRKL